MGRNWTRKSIEEIFFQMFKKYGGGAPAPTINSNTIFALSANEVRWKDLDNPGSFLTQRPDPIVRPSILQVTVSNTGWDFYQSNPNQSAIVVKEGYVRTEAFLVPVQRAPDTRAGGATEYTFQDSADMLIWPTFKPSLASAFGLGYAYFYGYNGIVYRIKDSSKTNPYRMMSSIFTTTDNGWRFDYLVTSGGSYPSMANIETALMAAGLCPAITTISGVLILCSNYNFTDDQLLNYGNLYLNGYTGSFSTVTDFDINGLY